jgi:hypothetical protein
VFAPRGRATADGNVLTVTGRWPSASGSGFCDWLMGGCMTDVGGPEPEPRLVL